jgi:hypothetical protein
LAAGTDLQRVVVEVRPLPGAVDVAPGRPRVEVVRGRWRRWGGRQGKVAARVAGVTRGVRREDARGVHSLAFLPFVFRVK